MEFTIKKTNINEIETKLYQLLNKHQKEQKSRNNHEQDFAYEVKDNESIVGGITARLWHTEMHVSLLALEKKYRRLGIAQELMKQIESDAKENNATIITITTQDFQAPEFYKKMGYNVFATLPNCPFQGTTRYYLEKRI